jgi:hypothetical protein
LESSHEMRECARFAAGRISTSGLVLNVAAGSVLAMMTFLSGSLLWSG